MIAARSSSSVLLAAVGAVMAGLVAFAHGGLIWLTLAVAGAATGLAAYMTGPAKKNSPENDYPPYRVFWSEVSSLATRMAD